MVEKSKMVGDRPAPQESNQTPGDNADIFEKVPQ